MKELTKHDPTVDEEAPADPLSARPSVPLPVVDPLRDVAVLNGLARTGHPYSKTVLLFWLAILVPLAVVTALDGTLVNKAIAVPMAVVFRESGLAFLERAVLFWARRDVQLPFALDIGSLIIVGLLLPAFSAVSILFYTCFERMVLGLHCERLHTGLTEVGDYMAVVERYDRKFSGGWKTLGAWGIGVMIALVLAWARAERPWWGSRTCPLGVVAYYPAAAVAGYYLGGIGTFKGWAAIRFCKEFFGGARDVLRLTPWHEDSANGLGEVGKTVSAVYLGALCSGLCLFVGYRYEMFGSKTWLLALLVLFVALDYSVFVSVPTYMVFRLCLFYRRERMRRLRIAIDELCERIGDWDGGNSGWCSAGDLRPERLRSLLEIREMYRRMNVLPLSLQQVVVGGVFYLAQLAQIAAVVLYLRS